MIIKLSNAEKVYRTKFVETVALNGLSLTINRGEFLALMGPSGCGKTTLLSIIGLLDNLTSGLYQFQDKDVTGLSEKEMALLRRSHLGFIFQDYHLLGHLNALNNVLLGLRFSTLSRREKRERAEQALERVGLSHRMKHRPHQLSGGQQQRVAIARAISKSPDIILADEPTGNLDSHLGDEIMQLLTDIATAGTTIIMVTHSKHDAEFANKTALMNDGQIVDFK